TGVAVLNAADPLTAEMKEHSRGQVTYFALDPMHPVMVEHRATGGTTAIVRDNHLIIAEGERETVIMSLADVPLTRGGRI
ncbi:hypothetical protein NL533_35550, partial [Klebsiella pneumoniae]|nr:hypothetical protein [Klebsiella pneumoniae]